MAVPDPTEIEARNRDPEAGVPFGRYRLQDEIGRGGMGVVWKAWDPELKRVVALKQILGDEKTDEIQSKRFLREARAAARLSHPNIVQVHELGVEEGRLYFTADFVDGWSLEHFLKDRLAIDRAARAARDVALALQHAHEQGIVHRDVKPANVLVDREGRARVTDFGLAKVAGSAGESSLTFSGAVMGTPRYMSPEQAAGRTGEVGPASDQYSLGAVLYELLAGRPAFGAENLRDLLNAICEEAPAPPSRFNPRIPPDLEKICLRALAKSPGDRYPAMADLARDLERFLEQASEPRARPGRRRWLAPALSALAGAALLGTLGVWSLTRDHRGDGGHIRAAASWPVLRTEEAERAIARAEDGAYDAAVPIEEWREDVEEAERLARELALASPDVAETHFLLARALEIAGRREEAEASCRRAVEIEPEHGAAHLVLARLLLKRASILGYQTGSPRFMEEQLADAAALVERAAEEIEIARRAGCGREADLAGALARAMAAYVRTDSQLLASVCLSELPSFQGMRGSEEIDYLALLASGVSGEAQLAGLDRVLLSRPKFALALSTRGLLREKAGDLPGAASDYEAAISIDPRSPFPWRNRGRLRFYRGDFPGAIFDLDEAIRLCPRWPLAFDDRAAAWNLAGDPQHAQRDYDEAIRLDPADAGHWANRGVFWFGKNEWALALADCDRALEIDPSRCDTRMCRGIARYKMGDFQGAIEDLETALQTAPENWERRDEATRALAVARKAAGRE